MNLIIVDNNVAMKQQLDYTIKTSTALLKAKTTKLDSLQFKRSSNGGVLQKEIEDLNKEIEDINKKRFFFVQGAPP